MKRPPLNIETLLEQANTSETPEDCGHRYLLRRELLCSRYFDEHRQRQARWNRMVTFTAPLVTGSVLVVVFLLVGSSMTDFSEETVAPEVIAQSVAIETVTESVPQETYIDAREPVPVYEAVQFVPTQVVNYVMLR